MKRKLSANIEISLFDLLAEAAKVLESNRGPQEPEQRILNFHKVQGYIEVFLENFFLQLFNNGFELDLEGINEEALSEIEDSLSENNDQAPRNVIDSFKDVIDVLEDIENAVYLDPPKEDDIFNAFLNFLPALFDNFKKDAEVLKVRISNYGAIKIRMEGILVDIGKLKEQLRLA